MSKRNKKLLSIVSILLCITIISSIPVQALSDTIDKNKKDRVFSSFNNIEGETEEIGNIIAEDTSARTEYTKEFLLDDGTTMFAQYNQPIHYKNDKNKWVDFDNSLVAENITATDDEAISSGYSNKNSNIKIKLSNKAKSNNMISLRSEDYSISWGYSNPNESKAVIRSNKEKLVGNEIFTTLKNLTSETVYKDVYKDVDLQYFVSSTGIKENIILKSSAAQNEFNITYKINNLTAKQTDNYNIVLFNKRGEEVYTISAPYMYDAGGELSTQLKLEIVSQKGANLNVKLTADYWFIHGFGRSFPITIDPEISTRLTSAQMSINETSGQAILSYGPYYLTENNSIILRANSLPALGDGDKLVSAKYNFETTNGSTLFESSAENPIKINAHKLNAVSGISFSYDETILDYDTLTYEDNKNFSFDLTKTMKDWYDNGDAVDGFLLEAFDTVGSKQVSLQGYSRTSATPALSVIYKNYVGTESNLSYNTISVGENAESNVSYYTGSLNIKQNIYEGTGSRMPVHITATYNSVLHNKLFANGSPAGYGWQFSFNQYVEETDSDLKTAGYDYIYTDEDGTEHYFKKNTSGDTEEWEDEDGLGLTLTVDDDYVYISNGDVVQKYDSPSNKGVLLSETDSNKNAKTYTNNS